MNNIETQSICQCNKPDCYFCWLRTREYTTTANTPMFETNSDDVHSFETPESVLIEICRILDMPPHLIKSDLRILKCTIPRQLYCYFARKLTNATYQEIGDVINRIHSTVLHSCKKIEKNLEIYDVQTVYYYRKLKMLIR